MLAYIKSFFEYKNPSRSKESFFEYMSPSKSIELATSYNCGKLMELTSESRCQFVENKNQIKFFKDDNYNQKVINVLETEFPSTNVVFHDNYCRVICEYNLGKDHTIYVNVTPLIKNSAIKEQID